MLMLMLILDCILSCSCYGVWTSENVKDICSVYTLYGKECDIRFNPAKNQLMTFGGYNT